MAIRKIDCIYVFLELTGQLGQMASKHVNENVCQVVETTVERLKWKHEGNGPGFPA